VPQRRGADDLGGELARHASRLLPVAPRDAHERLVDGPRLEPVGRDRVEQPADGRVGEALVQDPPERSELLRAQRRRARGHHRLLVPAEQLARSRQVGELREPLAQLSHLVGHATI
jgi:hypothetical protein